MGHLHAHRRRQAIAHGAQPARGHPVIGLLEVEALRRPHLVLADFGGDEDLLAAGQCIQPVDGILRLDDRVGIPVGQRFLGPPGVDLLPPVLQRLGLDLVLLRLPEADDLAQRLGRRPTTIPRSTRTILLICEASMSMMDLLRARREGADLAGAAVVEARAQIDHQVAVMHDVIGFPGAVHAQHAQPFRSRSRKRAQPHQGRGDGKAGQVHQFAQQLGGLRPGIDDAAAGIEHRPLRRRHHLHRLTMAAVSGSVLGR